MALARCSKGTPLRAEMEARDTAGLERTTRKLSEALAARFGPGSVEGSIQALVVSAG